MIDGLDWTGMKHEVLDYSIACFPPSTQGPFYCGVGSEAVYGRPLAEAHMDACCKANLKISGINAEVMPGQWEFQIGPAGPLEVGDHITVARWLLNRLGKQLRNRRGRGMFDT